MSSYLINRVTSDDNEALCALCKIPLPGKIEVALERSPNFFSGSQIQCEEIETYVCRKKGNSKIVGVFSVGKRRVFVGNDKRYIRYFSDLRVHSSAHGSRVIYEISRFVTDNNLLEDNVAQTIVFADNTVMLRLIQRLQERSKKLSIFKYFSAGNYISYMVKFTSARKINRAYIIRKAIKEDVPAMQKLLASEGPKKLFYPFYDFSLPSNTYYDGLSVDHYYVAFSAEELIGIVGVWDQHQIKQTRITGYNRWFKMLRPFVNFFGYITNGFVLPDVGTTLSYLTVHSIIIKNNNSAIFSSLLDKINNDYKKKSFSYLLIGLDEKDHLNKSLSTFAKKRTIKGKHFLVSNRGTVEESLLNSLYYLEAARI